MQHKGAEQAGIDGLLESVPWGIEDLNSQEKQLRGRKPSGRPQQPVM